VLGAANSPFPTLSGHAKFSKNIWKSQEIRDNSLNGGQFGAILFHSHENRLCDVHGKASRNFTPISLIRQYIEQQETPVWETTQGKDACGIRALYPHPEQRGFSHIPVKPACSQPSLTRAIRPIH